MFLLLALRLMKLLLDFKNMKTAGNIIVMLHKKDI